MKNTLVLGLALAAIRAAICPTAAATQPALAQHRSSADRPRTGCIVVDDRNFDKLVIKAKKPVLVDFWADWCGPCRIMSKKVKEIARDYEHRAVVAKLDVDSAGKTVGKYGITAVPTLIVFQNGVEVSRFVGVVSKARLRSQLNAALRKRKPPRSTRP